MGAADSGAGRGDGHDGDEAPMHNREDADRAGEPQLPRARGQHHEPIRELLSCHCSHF